MHRVKERTGLRNGGDTPVTKLSREAALSVSREKDSSLSKLVGRRLGCVSSSLQEICPLHRLCPFPIRLRSDTGVICSYGLCEAVEVL